MERKFGRDVVDDLEAIAGPKKWTREELDDIRTYYKTKLAELRAGKPPERPSQPISMSAMFGGLQPPENLL